MNWLKLTTEQQLEEIDKLSYNPQLKGIILFKHSTRCSISSMALGRLERQMKDDEQLPAYLIDLLNYRSVSQQIAERYVVQHESPQVLIIKNGKCIYQASHSAIDFSSIQEAVS